MIERIVSGLETKVALLGLILGFAVVNPSYSHTSWHAAYVLHKCAACPECCVSAHREEPVDLACSFMMDLTSPYLVDTADWCDRPGFGEANRRVCCVWDIEWMWCTTEKRPCSEWEYIEDGC